MPGLLTKDFGNSIEVRYWYLLSDTAYSRTAEEKNLEYKKESSQPTLTSSMDNSNYLESNDRFSSRSLTDFLRKIDAIFTCEENGVSSSREKVVPRR